MDSKKWFWPELEFSTTRWGFAVCLSTRSKKMAIYWCGRSIGRLYVRFSLFANCRSPYKLAINLAAT